MLALLKQRFYCQVVEADRECRLGPIANCPLISSFLGSDRPQMRKLLRRNEQPIHASCSDHPSDQFPCDRLALARQLPKESYLTENEAITT
jgi:hypothetical protein